MGRLGRGAAGAISGLLIAGAASFMAWYSLSHRPKSEKIVKPVQIPWQWRGSKEAKVCISASIPPDECVLPVIEYLEELVRKYPDRIYVEFASFSADTSKRTYEHIDPRHVPKSAQPGFEVGSLEGRPFCAYIMVNHRIGFVVEGKKVILAGPPGALYTIEDLDRIVRREMELQYGRAPKEGGRVPARQR